MNLKTRIEKLETRSIALTQPGYLSFATQEDYETALASGELEKYKYLKVYIGISPNDWS